VTLLALSRAECFERLADNHLGRVAITVDDIPRVFPVNYAIHGDSIIFRSDAGTKFDAACRGARVSFEIDDANPTYHTGWSVVATGRLELVTDETELHVLQHAAVRPWTHLGRYFLRIRVIEVTGRRIAIQPGDRK
jgi:uncharacterized protein